ASRATAVSWTVCPGWRTDAFGVTRSDAGGPGTTVTPSEPITDCDVALMVAWPSATPVTMPVCDTVAFVGSFDCHAIVAPSTTAPFASRAVAVSWMACPTCTMVGPATVTLATPVGGAGVTVTANVPDTTPETAVNAATPGETPVTKPVLEMVAIAGNVADQL